MIRKTWVYIQHPCKLVMNHCKQSKRKVQYITRSKNRSHIVCAVCVEGGEIWISLGNSSYFRESQHMFISYLFDEYIFILNESMIKSYPTDTGHQTVTCKFPVISTALNHIWHHSNRQLHANMLTVIKSICISFVRSFFTA